MITTILFSLFLVFFLVAFLSSAVTRFGLMEPEIEMQLSGYGRCWGCSITMVDCVTFFIAGSSAREAIRNHGDEFRA